MSADENLVYGENARSERFTTETGVNVTVLCIPKLALYVVTDADNFGVHWFRVTLNKSLYTVEYLLGGNEFVYCPIARFFARSILAQSECDESCETNASVFEAKKIVLNISLRKTDPET
ncbi:hypothetical protein B4U79_11227, partial [Dinothrombium tinctorium]